MSTETERNPFAQMVQWKAQADATRAALVRDQQIERAMYTERMRRWRARRKAQQILAAGSDQ